METPDPTDGTEQRPAQSGADGVTAVADLREPEQVRFALLDHPDVDNWTEATLDAADIVVNGVGFERKTPSDFASSLTEGRLDEQVEKLKQAYDHAYILIEGGFHNFNDLSHSRLSPQSARGKAASITARHGIPVIPCGDADAAKDITGRLLIDAAIRLGRKHTEEPSSAHLPTGPVDSSEPPGKMMWACLPHVGSKRAADLFEEFGSPTARHWSEASREADVQALQQVEGIGKKTAERIIKALRGTNDA